MLNPYEVAARLGISYFTVINYIKTGKIKGIRLDRVYRVSEEDLQEFIEKRKVEAVTK